MPSNPETNQMRERLKHASRLICYRSPFGAMPTEGKTDIQIDTYCCMTDVTLCYTYGLYDFSYHEEPMHKVVCKESESRYSVSLMLPSEPGLLFYWFKMTMPTSSDKFPHYFDDKFRNSNNHLPEKVTVFYVAESDTNDGEGKIYFEPPKVGANEDKYPYAFQITVYDKEFVTPDVMKGSMIYQIFPDRFSRDTKFSFEKMTNASPRTERVYHEDWYEDVDIYGKPETGYLACDFYGGSLRGIIQHLDYIKELGINIIYLNPIFEARSSHRYDTADYLQVDPILGGNEAFIELQKAAQDRGIKIIIDGVFSHTGADSKYFNKFDRYEGVGAFRSYNTGEESNYRSWYSFFKNPDGSTNYESWWGFPDLPNVNENDLSYRKFIFGDNGVVDTWTKRGAGGIRLDVSDELPDSFIKQMRKTLKAKTNGEGMLVGEVWEDASNKCSYGSYRDFMLGNTHDSVMGYTFRKEILDFLCGYVDARVFNCRLEGYRERYPAQAYYCIMNLVSSHDVPRILTMLSKESDPGSRELQKDMKVNAGIYEDCTNLSRIAFALQVGYIGASCLYYGDEVLMEGYKDPFNRRTYPWGKTSVKQEDNLAIFKRIARLRTDNGCLRTGFYKTLFAEGDSLVFERYLVDGKDFFGNEVAGSKRIALAINRGSEAKYLKLDDSGKELKARVEDNGRVPLSSNFVVGGIEGKTKTIGLPPKSFVFVIY